jgi:acetyl-CoA acyltransferase 1
MVAETYGVSREKQDEYALISHTRASKASESGLYKEEILPIRIGENVIAKDDTVRPGVTAESLAKLKPVFPDWGKALTTAGNASGVGDGAAITILTTRERAQREGWDIVAKWAGCSVTGKNPAVSPISFLTAMVQQVLSPG